MTSSFQLTFNNYHLAINDQLPIAKEMKIVNCKLQITSKGGV